MRSHRPTHWLVWVAATAAPFVGVGGQCADACVGVAAQAHTIVSDVVVDLLPEPVGAFFAARTDRLRRMVGDIPDRASARDTMRGDSHFVLLDIAAFTGSAGERRRAARAFPRNAGDAAKYCSRFGTSNCGRLPWGLIESYAGLVVAFRAHDTGRIMVDAAAIVHLACDASMPLNTTTIRQALSETRGEATSKNDAGDGIDGPLLLRFQEELIEAHGARVAFEVRVWPGRFEPVSDPVDRIFETLIAAHDEVDTLVTLARDARAQTSKTDRDQARAPAPTHARALPDGAVSLMEARLEAGALPGAELIHGAWLSAGKPVLQGEGSPHNKHAAAASGAADTSPDASPCGAPFCGSRDSTVFHRASCPHVRRIRKENMVGFAGEQDAWQSGRKPCRVCKPDEHEHDDP